MTVAILFCDKNGPYSNMEGVDLWDIERDARNYHGNYPVVAHPPCARWGKLAPVNHARWGTPIGEDGGCFKAALRAVQMNSGVLEHPKDSIAWKTYNLVKPSGNAWEQVGEYEWVGEVWQSDYGHMANKRTWLYYVGSVTPAPFRNDRKKGTHQVGGGVHRNNRSKPRIPDKLTHITPVEFAEYLVGLASKNVV